MPQAAPGPGHSSDRTKAAATTRHLPIPIGARGQKRETGGGGDRQACPRPYWSVCGEGRVTNFILEGGASWGFSKEVILEPERTGVLVSGKGELSFQRRVADAKSTEGRNSKGAHQPGA